MLRVALDADHTALRTTVVDVRHHDEQSWAGWEPHGLVGFVVDRSGLVVGSPAAEPGQTDTGQGDAGQGDAEQADAGQADDVVEQQAASTGSAAAGRDHLVRLDAGRVAGGRRKAVTLAVRTGGIGFDYRARLIARTYGDADDEPVEVGALTGTADRSAEVTLRFPAVDLPPRLQRLALEVELHLAEPGRTPALTVVG